MDTPHPDNACDFQQMIGRVIDGKTKPVGALGRLEALAAHIAAIQRTTKPSADRCLLTIFAADHGLAASGVSAYPQSVTRQMVLNFLEGGAAANVFARTVGAEVQVVDAGVIGEEIPDPRLVNRSLGQGTRNAIYEPAMSADRYDKALQVGQQIGNAGDCEMVCFGEMGIGNTSSASLISAKLLGCPVANLVGRGTGVDDARFETKHTLLVQAAARTPAVLPAPTALREYGGFEIVMMTGAVMAAARAGKIVLVDGFIASAAALAATRLDPSSRAALVFAHRSAEAGHSALLRAMDAEPLLDLGMRLGEGTGALLAVPLVRAAAAMLRDMASFEGAAVDGPA